MLLINKAYLCCKTDITVMILLQSIYWQNVQQNGVKNCFLMSTLNQSCGGHINANHERKRKFPVYYWKKLQGVLHLSYTLFWFEQCVDFQIDLMYQYCIICQVWNMKYTIAPLINHSNTMGRIMCNWLYSIGSPKVFGTE